MPPLKTIAVNNLASTSGLTSGSSDRCEVVSKLIGRAFESAQPGDRSMIIDHLLGSVGVLSLATIANGVFLNRRLEGASANPRILAGKPAPIKARDVRDLAQRVQQIDPQAIDEMVEAFSAPPLSTTSSVGEILADLPLRRTRRHLAD